jgi:N-acetylglucosaminyldiphosphoundecaprenol N-acetyl-beta-D-mannosaminyltransferase
MKKTIQFIFSAAPLLLFTGLLAGLLLVRILFGMVLPAWGAWGIGLCWGVMLFDYLLRAELFKQIGGFVVVLIAILILTGALVPKDAVARYPHVTSQQMVTGLESAWTAVYSGNVFKTYSLKQQLIDYGTSLGNLDPFRHGKMILYALLGLALGMVYLFPLEPFRPKAVRQRSAVFAGSYAGPREDGGLKSETARDQKSEVRGQRSEVSAEVKRRLAGGHDSNKVATQKSNGPISDLRSPTSVPRSPISDLRSPISGACGSYATRFALLFAAGAVFALHVELLQVFSPTRLVTFRSWVDSAGGLLAGLLVFIPLHLFYIWLAHFRSKGSRRFNVIGVGVDAVGMGDCLQLFNKIISGESPIQRSAVFAQGCAEPREVRSQTSATAGDQPSSLEAAPSHGRTEDGGQKSEVGSQPSSLETTPSHGKSDGRDQRSEVRDARPDKNTSDISPCCSSLHADLRPSAVAEAMADRPISDLCSPTSGSHRPAMTTALGVAGIVEARRNQKLQRILNESVLNTPDGMPLVWLGKLFGYRSIDRVYGPDLLRDACAYGESRGWRHYFWGAAPGIVEKLKDALEKKHPKIEISGICCPPFRDLTPEEEDALVEEVNASNTDIFWIGISTPKQLYFMDHIRSRLNCKIICPVGYAFDVNAGVEEDAPDWAKYSGFQWLHRAIKQPRLWKRYLPDNPRFVFEVMLQILHLKKYPMFVHDRPRVPQTDAEGCPRFPAGVVSLSAMTLESARDRVLNWVQTGQKHYVNICTADTMVQCFDRPDLAKIVQNAGMATTDGMPLVWLAHHYGLKDAARVYGPDLMLALCEATAALSQRSEVRDQRSEVRDQRSEVRDQRSEVRDQRSDARDQRSEIRRQRSEARDQRSEQLRPPASDLRIPPSDLRSPTSDLHPLTSDLRSPISEKKCISHFFYGATEEVLAQLKTNLLKKFPDLQIAGMVSPPFRPLTETEKDEMTEMINASGADIVWCGLGTPKQDYWVAEFRPRLNCAAILAVGAAFNFHAGHVKQAPRWMMKSGLEWLFRLCVEPRRLWRRYLVGNPRFIGLVAGQFLHNKRCKKNS